jgi:hypothetical protein
MRRSPMNGNMPRRPPKKATNQGGFSDAEWEKAFEESYKRNEEALRRLAKL